MMNNFSRLKLFLLFIFLIPAYCFSQAEWDTTYLIQNAYTLDNIYPSFYETSLGNYWQIPIDTISKIRKDSKRNLVFTNEQMSFFSSGDTSLIIFSDSVRWNEQGRITYFSASVNKERRIFNQYFYSNGKVLNKEIIAYGLNFPDTLQIEYDKSGKIAREKYSNIYGVYQKSSIDTNSVMSYLYDSKGNLVVMPQCPYGHSLKGRMIFEYDEEGKLMKRKFQLENGTRTICIDSLVYSFEDSAKTILKTKHYLVMPSFNKTVLIDEKKEDVIHDRVLEYSMTNGPQIGKWLETSVGGICVWNYDKTGKLQFTAISSVSGGGQEIICSYFYGAYGLCDSIERVYQHTEGKKIKVDSKKTMTISYTTDLLPSKISETNWMFAGNGKKRKWMKIYSCKYDFKWS